MAARRRGLPPSHTAGVLELGVEDCRMLLRSRSVGRLAVRDDEGIDVFPVNYLVHDDRILFRSGPGAKMMRVTEHPVVAFEVDSVRCGTAWSVVVHGRARRLGMDSDIEESGVRELRTLHPSEKNNFVEIEVIDMSGRLFHTATGPVAGCAAGVIAGALAGAALAVTAGLVLGRLLRARLFDAR